MLRTGLKSQHLIPQVKKLQTHLKSKFNIFVVCSWFSISKKYVLTFKLNIIESRKQFKKNQPNWITMATIMH